MVKISIRQASLKNLELIGVLFDRYRIFYGQKSDLDRATEFISSRLKNRDSRIFIAEINANLIVGFTQLYPTFSSVSAQSAWILNDLYVDEKYRRNGIALQLIKYAIQFADSRGAAGISLQTGKDNFNAQKLYEKLNFVRDDYFLTYRFSLRKN